jgi:hypothetical protein
MMINKNDAFFILYDFLLNFSIFIQCQYLTEILLLPSISFSNASAISNNVH